MCSSDLLVMMGSGTGAAEEAIERLASGGERVALLKVRLYRPFDARAFVEALPATTRRVVVLDRTKEPGAAGEPLYGDVITAFAEAGRAAKIVGGRYGLSSKEFTPAMVRTVLTELEQEAPKHPFTVGIEDDVTGLSLPWDNGYRSGANQDTFQALFYGLGSDGTVSEIGRAHV